MQLLPILSYVQHYKKYHATRFEAASVQYGLNQLEIDILLFLHNNPVNGVSLDRIKEPNMEGLKEGFGNLDSSAFQPYRSKSIP